MVTTLATTGVNQAAPVVDSDDGTRGGGCDGGEGGGMQPDGSATHTPDEQRPHGAWLHGVPSGRGVAAEQLPETHAPARWQSSGAVHVMELQASATLYAHQPELGV